MIDVLNKMKQIKRAYLHLQQEISIFRIFSVSR